MIPFIDSLEIKNKKPNVARDAFGTKESMKSFSENYLPYVFIAVCYEDKGVYVYCKDNEFLEDTGKWRKLPEDISVVKEWIQELSDDVNGRLDALSEDVDERLNTLSEQMKVVIETTIKQIQEELKTLDEKVDSDKNELTELIDTLNTTLSQAIETETQRAQSKELELEEEISSVDSKVVTETERAEGVELQLQNDLNDEITNRSQADETLQSNIESEASLRDSADIQLQENIESEAELRINADETLQTNIDNEKSARESAINELVEKINTEISERTEGEGDLDERITTNENSISTINSEIGDFSKITGIQLGDISTAIYSLYFSFMSKMEYANKKLIITYRNGYTTEIDVSPIITDTNIEELKNVSVDVDEELKSKMVEDGQALAFDVKTNKWMPRTFDLAKVLQDSKDYTDSAIKGMSKADAIACDEEPTYNDGVVTYKINGETKTKEISTSADTWFFYKQGTVVYQVIFVDGIEFKVSYDSSVNFDDFVKKESVVGTFTGEETDLTPIPNLGALMSLYDIIKRSLQLKVNTSDIVNTLVSDSTDVPLSANQGKILKGLIDSLTSGKVDKESGKVLSENDFTTTLKDKLDGIASGAEVNVQSDWNTTDSSDDSYIKNKPTIPTVPTDIVKYSAQTLTTEQKAQARTNIGAGTSSFSGSYNDLNDKPTIPTVPTDIVKYSAQTLTDDEKSQARSNIGAGTSSFSGSYNDLTNKPTIPSVSGKLDVDGSNATNTGTSTIVHSLDTATGDVTDNTEIVTSNANGYSTSDTKYYRRVASKLWNYIKGKADSTYAAKSHNQASNTINAMTSYSKPSSTSAITTSDTLNGAIGKLEKALDGKSSTDTKNTAGSTNSTSKLYLVGATSQASNPQTYSSNKVYETDGAFRVEKSIIADKVTMEWNSTTNSLDFVFS